MLILPIKKKWFDMIVSGQKREEYREIKPYYEKRFKKLGILDDRGCGWFGDLLLRNGYSGDSPTIKVRVFCNVGPGRPEWGAVPGKNYCVLQILQVMKPLPPEVDGDDGAHGALGLWWYACGECNGAINAKDSYCPHCGRPIDWRKR